MLHTGFNGSNNTLLEVFCTQLNWGETHGADAGSEQRTKQYRITLI